MRKISRERSPALPNVKEIRVKQLSAMAVNQQRVNQPLKFALEVGPLLIFFAANAIFGIFYATAALMIAVCISLLASRIFLGRISIPALVTGLFLMIFGGLTIYFQDDFFIKIKITILNVLFALILAAGLYFRSPVLKLALGEVLQMQEEGWRLLTLRWIGFFIFLAVLNEVIRRYFSPAWVSFKSFGIISLTFLFMMSQITLIMKHQISDASPKASDASST
jgi:intracellular septation protein